MRPLPLLILIVMLGIITIGAAQQPTESQIQNGAPTWTPPSVPPTPVPSELVPVIIGFKEKHDAEFVKGVGGKIKRQFKITPAIAARVPPGMIERLRANPNVDYVEEDAIAYTLAENLPWGIDKIEADQVWASPYNNKGTGIKVAILDTGIQYDHPDLKNNIKGGMNFAVGYSDGCTTSNCWTDRNGHGTHVSGIVAAEDNEVGVIGAAPEANLYAVKVLSDSGSGYYSDVIQGIEWARTNKIQVISMSLGGTFDSLALQNAVKAARLSNIILVGAAGNSGDGDSYTDNIIYPARYDSVISVGATDSGDSIASWSSDGSALDVSAPGVNVLSTYIDNRYVYASGTSMAAPHVSGTVALMLKAGIPPSEIQTKLQTKSIDLLSPGWDRYSGWGRINALVAAITVTPTPTITVPGTIRLPIPGILPDSPWYGFKKRFERMGTFLTFGDEAKMQRNIDLAETRLAEAIAMSEQGKPVESLMIEYNNRITEANRFGSMIDGGTRERAMERMAIATNRHLAIMERVRQQVPEQARQGIDRAINASTMRNQQVLENLEEGFPGHSANLILNLTEERANRLIDEAQYQTPMNWSDMRDMMIANIDRQISILETLKERAKTEKSKQGIQRAIERLKEWKEKLLAMEIPDIPRPRPVPTITRTPRPAPTFTIPPRPTPLTPIYENSLTIGAVWNAETPMAVKIKITAAGMPVEAVNIKIDDIDAGVTDSHGELIHTFPGLGSYKVQASKTGYRDATVTLTLMQGGISISAQARATMP